MRSTISCARSSGPSGKRPAAIAERVKKTWELGDGWAKHVTVEFALGTREGSSVRGGSLGGLHDGALADAATVDKVIDAAVAAVAGRRGIAVALPSAAGAAGGGVVDSAALTEFAEQVTGRDGVLASAARTILNQLGLDNAVSTPEASTDAELIDLVTAELGSDWPRLVAPVFDGRKAVLFDDRWASAREDLVKLWLMDEGDIDADWQQLSQRFEGAGHVVGKQASLVAGQGPGRGPQRPRIAVRPRRSRCGEPGQGSLQRRDRRGDRRFEGFDRGFGGRRAARRRRDGHRHHVASSTTTGSSSTATSTATTPASVRRCGWCPRTWRPTPTSTRSSAWVGNEQSESLGPKSIHLKDAQTPTLLFPFAAPRVAGDLSEAGSRSEMEMKVLLWAVQRLIGGLSHIGSERDIASRLHVVLPGSPNRGMFGGDGAYGEAKSALDAVVTRWKAESSWAQRVSLAHALIGWTRGTGLMGANDAIVNAVEEAGVTTYSTEQMATDAARAVQHRVEGGRRAGAAEGRPDRWARRHRHRHVRAGRQGPRGHGRRGRRGRARSRTAPSPRCRRRRVASPRRRRRRGPTSTSTPPTWW